MISMSTEKVKCEYTICARVFVSVVCILARYIQSYSLIPSFAHLINGINSIDTLSFTVTHTHANSLHLQETIGCYFKRIAALRCSIRFPSLSSAPSPHSRVFLASNTNSIAKFDKIYAPSSTSAHYFLKWNELLISYASHHRRALYLPLLWRLRVRSA